MHRGSRLSPRCSSAEVIKGDVQYIKLYTVRHLPNNFSSLSPSPIHPLPQPLLLTLLVNEILSSWSLSGPSSYSPYNSPAQQPYSQEDISPHSHLTALSLQSHPVWNKLFAFNLSCPILQTPSWLICLSHIRSKLPSVILIFLGKINRSTLQAPIKHEVLILLQSEQIA